MKIAPYDKHADTSYTLGVFPSLELLKTRPESVVALYYHPDGLVNLGVLELIELCKERDIDTFQESKQLERLSGKGNCYAALAFAKYQDPIKIGQNHLVLHNIADMGNLGTILRTSIGFGMQDIVLIRPCVDCFDPKVIRSSMGAIFHANISYFDSMEQYEQQAGDRQYFFFRLQQAVPLSQVEHPIKEPYSLVFGNESSGLTGEMTTKETGVLIPHGGQIDSLNLSIAVGIGVYEFTRRDFS